MKPVKLSPFMKELCGITTNRLDWAMPPLNRWNLPKTTCDLIGFILLRNFIRIISNWFVGMVVLSTINIMFNFAHLWYLLNNDKTDGVIILDIFSAVFFGAAILLAPVLIVFFLIGKMNRLHDEQLSRKSLLAFEGKEEYGVRKWMSDLKSKICLPLEIPE